MKKLIVNRPWGNFIQYTQNELSTVKLLTILPQQELSLQYHSHRREMWLVVKGHPHLVIGDKEIQANPGEEFEVGQGVSHQIKAVDDEVQIVEISFGEFDETDIIHLKDKYGRV